MRSIAEVDFHPSAKGHTTTERKLKPVRPRLEALLAQDPEGAAASSTRSISPAESPA